MISRLHLTEAVVVNNKRQQAIIKIIYKGDDQYEVVALNADNEQIAARKFKHIKLKGNGRKTYAKMRDLALNAVEGKELNSNRVIHK